MESDLIDKVELIAFKIFQNKDISKEDFKYFVENVDKKLIKTIICSYKGEFVKLGNARLDTTHNLHLMEIFSEMLTCDLENLPLYINEPFEEILKLRLNHGI